ncbi:MAG TPA: hypothetical protein VEF89_17050 [Solirubrobacteraceae bacterium]|nr:hypothetical protein [Solirubrobacteraceae bacterium]
MSCPATTQCSAIDTGGQGITFNPQTGQPSASTSVTGNTPEAVRCPPALDLCAVVDSGGGAETFGSTGESSTSIDGNGSSGVALTGLSCAPDCRPSHHSGVGDGGASA